VHLYSLELTDTRLLSPTTDTCSFTRISDRW